MCKSGSKAYFVVFILIAFVFAGCNGPIYPFQTGPASDPIIIPVDSGGAGGGGGTDGGGNGGGEPADIIVSWNTREEDLAALPTGSAENPTTVKLDLNGQRFSTTNPTPPGTIGWGEINSKIKAAGKYVILDLSGCTATDDTISVSHHFRPEPNDMTAIYSNSYIKGIVLPSSLNSIGEGAFRSCRALTSITIPDSVRSIGGSAFYFCEALTSITIPPSVTKIENGTFYNCSNLTRITIPNSVESIGKEAFLSCKKLTSITIPPGVTSIEEMTFYSCVGLASVNIPSSVTSIKKNAFQTCGLTRINIPLQVTSIEEQAFAFCSRLNSVIIPADVTSIGNGAFHSCIGLTEVSLPGGIASFGNNVFPQGLGELVDGGNALRDVYLAPAPIGGAGIYTRDPGGTVWTKQ